MGVRVRVKDWALSVSSWLVKAEISGTTDRCAERRFEREGEEKSKEEVI